MIAGLIGEVYKRDTNKILFNVNGVIYEVFMSLHSIKEVKNTILITQIIREDSITLFGFLNTNEKALFENLIKINGVGPKMAMAICNYFNYEELINIVNSNNFDLLKKVPGVGLKTAQRIIIEIGGKLDSVDFFSKNKHDALLALEALGFKHSEIGKLIQDSISTNTNDIVKEVLQKINK